MPDKVTEDTAQSSGGLRHKALRYLDAVADGEISEASHMRMLILTIVLSTWATVLMMSLYVTELIGKLVFLQTSIYFSIIAFAGYFLISRMPIIARNIQIVGGWHD